MYIKLFETFHSNKNVSDIQKYSRYERLDKKEFYKDYIGKSLEELSKNYNFFHLSWDRTPLNDDFKTFTFLPRIPKQPYGFETGTIEDDFTPRVSLGKSISDCLFALPEDDYGSWAIYATNKTDNIISTKEKFKQCPIGYGKDFDLVKWIDSLDDKSKSEIYDKIGDEIENTKDLDILSESIDISHLPTKYRDMFKMCVPDALETDEYWSLEPITMDYLGYIGSDDIDNIFNNKLDKVYPKF